MLMGCFGDRDYPTASVTTLFFFLRRKKNSKRKSCKGDAPLTPAVISDTTTACGSSGEDSVQAAQRGQVKVQIIKRPAANIFFGFPSRAAKQGRGNESVSGGDREPRLTEPQRDSSARRR